MIPNFIRIPLQRHLPDLVYNFNSLIILSLFLVTYNLNYIALKNISEIFLNDFSKQKTQKKTKKKENEKRIRQEIIRTAAIGTLW